MTAESVRAALQRAGYTSDGVLDLLGGDAFAALGRGERVPARHALAAVPDGPLAELVRLFLLGEQVPADRAAAALPLPAAAELGLVGDASGRVRARVHLQPYPVPGGTIYLASDFPAEASSEAGPLADDHVIGVGGASVTLATITPRRPAARVLDLGTGCGIQAVLAAAHSARVVATDASGRAVRLAALSAALSGVQLDLRTGSLFDPVAGEEFDLIVANPPFVIAPAARHTYREAPLGGDDLGRDVVRGAASHLAPGGIAVILANWLHVAGQAWQERLAGWAPDGCRVWAVQREHLSPEQYAQVWLRDSAELGSAGYPERYAQWVAHLRNLRAQGVGFGWIVVQRAEPAWFAAEDLSDADGLPDGDQVLAALAALTARHRADAVTVLGARPRFTADAIVQRTWRPAAGASGAQLMVGGAWRPFEPVDQEFVDLMGRSGTLAERILAVAGRDEDLADELTARALVAVRRLIGAGLITIEP